MSRQEPLHPNNFYHVYGRGINGAPLFPESRNYPYFLQLYAKYIVPIGLTYAYCLMNNHYHFLVSIRAVPEGYDYDDWLNHVGLQFGNLFGTYTKALNKAQRRTGGLFERPFKRKRVDDARYFTQLIRYIHRNPQYHGFVDDFRDWKYSSYRAILANIPTQAEREAVLEWFGGKEAFVEEHLWAADREDLGDLIVGDE